MGIYIIRKFAPAPFVPALRYAPGCRSGPAAAFGPEFCNGLRRGIMMPWGGLHSPGRTEAGCPGPVAGCPPRNQGKTMRQRSREPGASDNRTAADACGVRARRKHRCSDWSRGEPATFVLTGVP